MPPTEHSPAPATASASDRDDSAGLPEPRAARLLRLVAYVGMGAMCLQGSWRATLWKDAEPRVVAISAAQYAHGLLRIPTFSGMPFLEKPPLHFDLTAIAFHLTGGPSVIGARAVVALMGALWLISAVLVVRRARDANAGALAGALLAVAPCFSRVVSRIMIDISLIAFLSLALFLLYRAISEDDGRVDNRWWWACIAAVDLAALTKGVFATFLFVAPTLAYSVLARDWRIVKVLVHPMSLVGLLLPHLLWALALYTGGGQAYLYETFLNNTIGRLLHHRFFAASLGALPYGDVGPAYPWDYFLLTIPEQALPGILALPFALVAFFRDGGFRGARNPWSRFTGLALCWGVVPPLLLSFSSYKGRYHIGASTSALVLVGALWLARRLPKRSSLEPHWVLGVVAGLYVGALLLVGGSFFGLPATRAGAVALEVGAGVAGIVGLVGALRARSHTLGIYLVLAALTLIFVSDRSPGGDAGDDERNSMDAFATWVADQVEGDPVAVYFGATGAGDAGPKVGHVSDQVIGTLVYRLGRDLVVLHAPARVQAFLRREAPGFFVECRGRDQAPPAWPETEPSVGWQVSGGNRRMTCSLIANRSAAARLPVPRAPVPGQTMAD